MKEEQKNTLCPRCHGTDTNCDFEARERKENWREEFEKRRPRTDEKLLSGERFSKDYEFGYKSQIDGEIHEIVDWGNIKTFISNLLSLRDEELVKRLEGMKKEDPHYSKEERELMCEIEGIPKNSIELPVAEHIHRSKVDGYNKSISDAITEVKKRV